MEQNDICDHTYKGYIQYYSPIGLWLIALIVIYEIEFGINDNIYYTLGLISAFVFLIPFLIDALSERKWKPHYWVNVNDYKRSHRKADNFFIYQMVLAGCSVVIYIGNRMYISTPTAEERFGVIIFILLMIGSVISIAALDAFVFKTMSREPNIYYRFMDIDFNIMCAYFEEILGKSNFYFYSEFHKKSFSAPTYKKYLFGNLGEDYRWRFQLFLTPEREGSKATIYYIFNDEIERAEELKKLIDIAIQKKG